MSSKDIEARRATGRAWHARNKTKKNAKSRAYYRKNKKVRNAKRKQWREEHSEHDKKYGVEYRKRTRVQQKIKNANYHAANSGEINARHAAAAKANPEPSRARAKKRRALKKGAAISNFTHAQWVEMQIAYDHRCYYCKKRAKGRLTQDHITPLSKGGNHTLHNIVPACSTCNSKKHIGPAPIPVQPLLL